MRLLWIIVSIGLLIGHVEAEDYFVDSFYRSRVFHLAIDLRVADDRGERSSVILCLKQACEGIPFQTLYPENMYRILLHRGTKVSVRTKMVKSSSGELYKVAYWIFPKSRISGKVEDCKIRGAQVLATTAYTLSDSKGMKKSAKIIVSLDDKKVKCEDLLDAEVDFFGTLQSNNRFVADRSKIEVPAPTPSPTVAAHVETQLRQYPPTPTPSPIPTPTPTVDPKQVLPGVTAVFPSGGGRAIQQPNGCRLSAVIDVDIRGDFEPQVSITTEVSGLVGFPIVSKSKLLRDIKVVVRQAGTHEILFSVNLLLHNRQDVSTYDIEQALRQGKYEIKYIFPQGIGCDNQKNSDFREILR